MLLHIAHAASPVVAGHASPDRRFTHTIAGAFASPPSDLTHATAEDVAAAGIAHVPNESGK